MSLVGVDAFAGESPLLGQWRTYRPELLSGGAPDRSVAGECRLFVAGGGSGGGLWFNNSTGTIVEQWVHGDVDVAADVQVTGAGYSGLPAAGAARLALIGLHDAVRVPSGAGLSSSVNEVHVGIGYVTGGGQDPSGNTLLVEWKHTAGSSSVFNTISLPGGSIAAAGRVWVRLRRVGTEVSVYAAPIDPEDESRLPAPDEWTLAQTRTASTIRPLATVGMMVYSSAGTANVGGRFRRFVNYHDPA